MKQRIQPCPQYPAYWEYDGVPTMLIGGSVEDNLFQIPHVEEHLKQLHDAGGNYIRCTMSSRDPGDVWPYERTSDGRYDLNRQSEEYWRRFSQLLRTAYELDIIVQIELWDRFDFSRAPWAENPFNPKNNINYAAADSLLAEDIATHPGENENRFFFTVPEADDNAVVLPYQRRFADELLRISLPYPNVLYCMDNETSAIEAWGAYWARYVADAASRLGVAAQVTEMWDPRDITDEMHKRTFDHPELYTFCDVSQNNHQTGVRHMENIRLMKERCDASVRPFNNVKIYGAKESRYGTEKDGIERFWRNIFAKSASVRFHRPPSGLGLSDTAMRHIRAARMFAERFRLMDSQVGGSLEHDASVEVYGLAAASQAAVLLCGPGEAFWNAADGQAGSCVVRWLNIGEAKWEEGAACPAGEPVRLQAPSGGVQVALLEFS